MLCEPSTPLSPCSHHLDAGLGGPPEQPAPPFRGDGSSFISGFHASDQTKRANDVEETSRTRDDHGDGGSVQKGDSDLFI